MADIIKSNGRPTAVKVDGDSSTLTWRHVSWNPCASPAPATFVTFYIADDTTWVDTNEEERVATLDDIVQWQRWADHTTLYRTLVEHCRIVERSLTPVPSESTYETSYE